MALHIHARIDDVMELLMQKLNIPIPQFQLKRYAKVILDEENLSLGGIDPSGGPYSIFKSVTLNGQKKSKVTLAKNEQTDTYSYPVTLGFQGHYGEPNLQFSIPRHHLSNKAGCRLEMIYCPYEKKWVQLNVQDVKTRENIDLIEF